ncbi:hypothetical protein DPEC_G00166570 [Dallia pectoralis]|uniref:Uncharacterized protein n=1 Tax=Dallia pectoralis TaxID=75939 RepID=A0ACC2GHM1_DALPE|nr:hypothetical protein DPEC_G00166570 [Dallia pectoralis]
MLLCKDIKGLPRQLAGNACGIFMLMYALYIVLGADFDFTTDDMAKIRTWWCLLLLSGHSVDRLAQKRKPEVPIIIEDKEVVKRPRTIPSHQLVSVNKEPVDLAKTMGNLEIKICFLKDILLQVVLHDGDMALMILALVSTSFRDIVSDGKFRKSAHFLWLDSYVGRGRRGELRGIFFGPAPDPDPGTQHHQQIHHPAKTSRHTQDFIDTDPHPVSGYPKTTKVKVYRELFKLWSLKMDIDVPSANKQNDYYATKTDLSLLLECLKYQMRCPDSQKQALLTIYSICQQKDENVDSFREMGGLMFVYNLSKSSCHSEVRETALFTLGMLAEVNVYCKQALCRKEMFRDLAECLMHQDSPLTQRGVTAYLLSVLVANNRSGQTFAQTSGCLDILLDLFRTSFPLSDEGKVKPANVNQLFQVWRSVSSALCGCVNNPQNEESQRICVSAFPFVKTWLQQLSHPRTEMVQPICSFITMTVANNYCAQESFATVGGLKTLTCTLIRLASDATHSPLACLLSVILTKTLSACVSDNPVLASGLAVYGLVTHLHTLLSSPLLDPQGRLVVILALGHCTEASEEHQAQLLQCGGLSVIITLLTESGSPEVSKAAVFILQSCRQAAGCLRGAHLRESSVQGGDMDDWRSARDMLYRIKQLERRQVQRAEEDTPNSPVQLHSPLPVPPSSFLTPHPSSHQRCEERKVRWTGEKGRNIQDGSHERVEKEGDELGIFCEHTPMRQFPGEQARVRERESPALTPLTRKVRGCWRAQGDQEEDLTEGVRRQVFQAEKENQKLRPSRRERAVEWRKHSDNPRERENHRAVYSTILADQETERDSASRGNTTALYTNNLLGKDKNPAAGTHAQTERRGDVHPEMGMQAHTLSRLCQGKRTSLSGAGHTGAGGDTALVLPTGNGCSVSLGKGLLERHSQKNTHSQVFKCPASVSVRPGMSRQKTLLDDDDALSLCSELLDTEISKILETPATRHNPTYRCSGCLLRFAEVTSWSFSVLQRSCPYSCDLHQVLQQVTNEHTRRLRDLHRKGKRAAEQTWPHDVCLTPLKKPVSYAGITLTPVHRGGQIKSVSHVTSRGQERGPLPNVQSSKILRDRRMPHRENDVITNQQKTVSMKKSSSTRTEQSNSKIKESWMSNDERRERRYFSCDEERYLCQGVERFGSSWNSILWTYPFKPGRTNIDLAKKYKRMQSKF